MKHLLNIIIGIIMIFIFVKACQRTVEVNSWPETSGVILSSHVEEYQDSEKYTTSDGRTKTKWEDEFRINFKYSYQFNSVEYTGSFTIDDLDRNSDVQRKLRAYPNGKTIKVKYDPENPYDNQAKY